METLLCPHQYLAEPPQLLSLSLPNSPPYQLSSPTVLPPLKLGPCVDFMYWGVFLRENTPNNVKNNGCDDFDSLLLLWQADHDVPIAQGWPLDTGIIENTYVGDEANSQPCRISIPNNDTQVTFQCENQDPPLGCERTAFNIRYNPNTCGPSPSNWIWLATNVCVNGKP